MVIIKMKRIIYLFLLFIYVIIGEFLIFYNNFIMILVISFLGLMLILLIDQSTKAVHDTLYTQKIKLICIALVMSAYLSLAFVGLIVLVKVIPDIIFLNSFGALLFGIVFSAALYEGNFIMRDIKEYSFYNIRNGIGFLIFSSTLFCIALYFLIL
jgi:hypothetical protein